MKVRGTQHQSEVKRILQKRKKKYDAENGDNRISKKRKKWAKEEKWRGKKDKTMKVSTEKHLMEI